MCSQDKVSRKAAKLPQSRKVILATLRFLCAFARPDEYPFGRA